MNLYSKELMFLAKKNTASQGILEGATHEYTAKNPICGDRVRWTAIVEDRKIIDLKHHTKGCLLCKAGAALLFEQVHAGNRKTAEVQELICHYSTQIEQLKTDDVLDAPVVFNLPASTPIAILLSALLVSNAFNPIATL